MASSPGRPSGRNAQEEFGFPHRKPAQKITTLLSAATKSSTKIIQKTWKCDVCSQLVDKAEVVSGAAKIVDGRMLVCPRCLAKQSTKKSSNRTPAIAGFLAAVAIVGAGFLVPRYFLLLGALGCVLTAVVALVSSALTMRERVLGLCGAFALGVVCAGGMYALGLGESVRSEVEHIREETEAVRKLLAADDILEAQRRASPLLSPPPTEVLRKPSPEARAVLQALDKCFEEWFAKDYGKTSPLERSGLIQLFRGFGLKDESGKLRFAGLRIAEGRLQLQVRENSDSAGRGEESSAPLNERDRTSRIYGGYLLDYFSDIPFADIRWVRVQPGSDPVEVHVFTLSRADQRRGSESASEKQKGPPGVPPPNGPGPAGMPPKIPQAKSR